KHGPARLARRVDAVGIGAAVGDFVFHHLDGRLCVPTTAVREALRGADVPTAPAVALREDHDEAILVRRGDDTASLRDAEHGRRSRAVPVRYDEDGGTGRHL